MKTVGIKNWEIWAFVGLYPEEKKVPNLLNISISVSLKKEAEAWVDYTQLVAQTKAILSKPHDLLEDVANAIRDKILSKYPTASLKIRIEKLHPPTGEHIQASFVAISE